MQIAIIQAYVFWLIEQRAHWTAAFIMVQKEMADRLTGEVGTKSYGRLTVMIGAFLNVETRFTIPPDVFIPKPKVKSAIIKLVKRHDPLIEDKYFERFEKIVAAAFSRRRKMLRNTLSDFGLPEEIQKKIDFTRRPETLSISEFSELAKTI